LVDDVDILEADGGEPEAEEYGTLGEPVVW